MPTSQSSSVPDPPAPRTGDGAPFVEFEQVVAHLASYDQERDSARHIRRFVEGEMLPEPLQCRKFAVEEPAAVAIATPPA